MTIAQTKAARRKANNDPKYAGKKKASLLKGQATAKIKKR